MSRTIYFFLLIALVLSLASHDVAGMNTLEKLRIKLANAPMPSVAPMLSTLAHTNLKPVADTTTNEFPATPTQQTNSQPTTSSADISVVDIIIIVVVVFVVLSCCGGFYGYRRYSAAPAVIV